MSESATRIRITVHYAQTSEPAVVLANGVKWASQFAERLRESPHVTDVRIDAVPVVVVDLPQRFYDDHVSRDLPAGCFEKRLARKHRIALDRDSYDELLDDARHYADPGMGFASEEPGLVASARATVRRLEAVDAPPQPEPHPPGDPGGGVPQMFFRQKGEAEWHNLGRLVEATAELSDAFGRVADALERALQIGLDHPDRRAKRIADVIGDHAVAVEVDRLPAIVCDGFEALSCAERLVEGQGYRCINYYEREQVESCSVCGVYESRPLSGVLPEGWAEEEDAEGNLVGFLCPEHAGER